VIRVLIAEPITLTREGLVAVLGREKDIELAAIVRHADEAAPAARSVWPDVALLAATFPERDGVAATAVRDGVTIATGARKGVAVTGARDGAAVATAVRDAAPGCRCAILGAGFRSGDLRRAAAAGVRGFLLCDSGAEYLTGAVRQLAVGEQVVDPRLSFGAACPLTTRETDALRAAAQGSSTAEIASVLCLSEGTVRNYLSRAIAKTGARNRVDAIRIAGESGWLLPVSGYFSVFDGVYCGARGRWVAACMGAYHDASARAHSAPLSIVRK